MSDKYPKLYRIHTEATVAPQWLDSGFTVASQWLHTIRKA